MRDVDTAFRHLVEANPFPDPAALSDELKADPEAWMTRRNVEMSTITTADQDTDSARRGLVPAAAAFALVLLVGLSATLTGGFGIFDEGEPTPVEIAEAYMAAVDSYDSEEALALLAEEAQITDGMYREREELEAGFAARERWGFTVSPFQCGLQSEEVVWCTYGLDSGLQQIVDHPPIEATFRFTIRDGKILQVDDGFPLGEFSPNVFSPFVDWLDTEHPGAFDSLFFVVDGRAYPSLTPESLDLVTVYTDLYDESVNNQED